MSPNVSRSREALRGVDFGLIGKRDDHAHTRHGHEAAADDIIASYLSGDAIETKELVHEHATNAQHGLGHRCNRGMPFDELENASLKGTLGHSPVAAARRLLASRELSSQYPGACQAEGCG